MRIDGTNMEGSKAGAPASSTYGPIAVGRLGTRGIPNTYAAHCRSVSTWRPRSSAGRFLNLIPMFVLIAAFMGGHCATDATAGSEKGVAEPPLLTPARALNWQANG